MLKPINSYLKKVEENEKPLSTLTPGELETALATRDVFHARLNAIDGQLPGVADGLRERTSRLEVVLSDRIKAEQRRLQEGRTGVGDHVSVWPVYDALDAIRRLLGDSLGSLHAQWEQVELLHSQELAIALAKVLGPYFVQLKKGGGKKKTRFTEIGAKTGDLLTRLCGKLQQMGVYVEARGFDLEPRAPLFEKHSALADVSPPNPIYVDGADLLDLGASNIAPPDVLLLSNILHKLPPELHTHILQQVHQSVGPGKIVVLNDPHYEGRNGTSHLGALYRSCDYSEHPEAIRPHEEWKAIALEAGFRIVGKHYLGTEAGFLDDFQHSVLVLKT